MSHTAISPNNKFKLVSQFLGGAVGPINGICLLALTVLCIVICLQTHYAFEKMLNAEIETTFALIETTSRDYLANYDLGELKKVADANLSDIDIESVEFFDQSGKSLAQAKAPQPLSHTEKKTREIKSFTGTSAGTVSITFSRERSDKLFWTIVICCIIGALIVQTIIIYISMKTLKSELEKVNLSKELEIQSAITAESKKVETLVDNMQQALFSISKSGEIVEPVSKFSQKVFGKKIVGTNIIDTLFKNRLNQPELISTIQSTFTNVFGEDSLQWDLSEGDLPRKIPYQFSEDETALRTFKVQPAPIWNDQETLEKILFVVEDITDIENLEKQISEQRQQAQLLEEILKNRIEDLNDFMKSASLLLTQIESSTINQISEMAPFLRDLHTLKGNARLFHLKKLSDQIHSSETVLLEFTKSEQSLKDAIASGAIDQCKKQQVFAISSVYKKYSDLLKRFTSTSAASDETTLVNQQAIRELGQLVSELTLEPKKEKIFALEHTLQRLWYRSARVAVQRYENMVNDIAHQLKKEIKFEVVGDALISPSRLNSIQDCLVHLIRNALDHGIENAEERKLAGKPEPGLISIGFNFNNGRTEIQIRDNGRGIDPEKLVQIAIEKALISSEQAKAMSTAEKLNIIFLPGFSSKKFADDVSGRGIGMDAVKNIIESINGNLEITTQLGRGSTFVLSFTEA